MTIFTRSAAENFSKLLNKPFNWPKDWCYLQNGRPVTYGELRAKKREEQARHIESMNSSSPVRRAAQIWTFHVPGFVYGGWHLYVRTLQCDVWIRDFYDATRGIMSQFPCGLLPLPENFYAWKKAFAEQYFRPGKRKQGMVNCWAMVKGCRINSILLNKEIIL